MRTAALTAIALVALAVPMAAVADDEPTRGGQKVKGPSVVSGNGFFRGDLEMRGADESRPVVIAGTRGYVGLLALSDDVKVRCIGYGEATTKETQQGIVYFCKGLRGAMKVVGSHFVFRGYANRYVITLPAGASGTLHGRFRRDGGAERGNRDRGERTTATPQEPTATRDAA